MEENLAAHTFTFEGRLARSKGRASRDRVANARVTAAELEILETAAKAAGQALSEWSRGVLLREARQSNIDPLWTETIANRMLLLAMLRPIATGQKMTPERFDELVSAIKLGKRSMAQEVMAQYKPTVLKEPTDGE